jgi:hypothetical protein
MITHLPEDVLCHIATFMDTTTLCNWRIVVPFSWNTRHVYDYGAHTVSKKMKHKKYTRKCVMCKHQCITSISWMDGRSVDFVPWCVLHIDPQILENIDMYCFGDIDLESMYEY